MSSSFGTNLKITIFGESHAKAIGMTIDGLPAGTPIDEERINTALSNRKINTDVSTKRNEKDKINFLCGVFNGRASGAPLTFTLENKDTKSSDYVEGNIRPGHADLTNYLKYCGYNDYRGGGFSSGRITASIIVLGEICKSLLEKYDTKIITHVKEIQGIKDAPFSSYEEDEQKINSNPYPTISKEQGDLMLEEIVNALDNGDSVGGTLETAIINTPIGLGEPYFDSLESIISHLAFSIGGVKGITFGDIDKIISSFGSQINDEIELEDNKVVYKTNNAAGINGGISNGEPITFVTYVKPVSSIPLAQHSINVKNGENINLEIKGRHDNCIVHRIKPVLDSLVSYAVVDLLMAKESKNI